ncbi:plasmid partitioning/stability family protein [Rosenbergiella metrosideri]|uniref:plasmid partitioning/stability family protein n=1 Tax=Rosenbergiella metrosideri TaxID=2921185 RepID=UPI001F4F18FC|nr:plasmid partitioning/stability family protein [Rosenbergiella metrosideri]
MNDFKKIQFNLYPDENIGDEEAIEAIQAIRQKERGRAYRAFLLSGVALFKLDKRLPYLLAELLTPEITLEEVKSIFNSVLPGALNESDDKLDEIIALLKSSGIDAQDLGAIKNSEAKSAKAEVTPEDETLANSKGMFPGL